MPTPTIMSDLENKRKALEVQADEVKSNISLEMDDLKKNSQGTRQSNFNCRWNCRRKLFDLFPFLRRERI